MNIIDKHDLVEEIMASWQGVIGSDYPAYYGHVYRVLNFYNGLMNGKKADLTSIAIAACFHDLGIWSDQTFDYLSPSIKRMQSYLKKSKSKRRAAEIEIMISMHHKLTPYKGKHQASVEPFRCADLIDLSLGTVKLGLPSQFVKEVRQQFPNNGFHKKLIHLTVAQFLSHPLKPMPMLKF